MKKEKLLRIFSDVWREIPRSPDGLFYATLVCYMTGVYSQFIRWAVPKAHLEVVVREIMSAIALLLMGVQIAAIPVRFLHRQWQRILAVVLSAALCYSCTRISLGSFDMIMILFLLAFSLRRNYRKTVRAFFLTALGILAAAFLGLTLGYTFETPKIGPYGVGYSFGFTYSNMTGTVLLLLLMSGWYLLPKKGKRVTFVISWPAAVFVYFVIRCRTVAGILAAFPVLWALISDSDFAGKLKLRSRRVIKGVLISMPFLCFGLTVLLASNAEKLVQYTYDTAIENLSMRFVQSGLAFKKYGFPLFGQKMLYTAEPEAYFGGVPMQLKVMDNAYSSYAILRGMIYLTALLAWIAYVQWKAIKRRDYALLLVSVLLCIYGLMERWGLDIYYNFALFYPLAAIGGTKADAGPAGSGEKEDAP